jgi:hypothetical protein
MNARLVLGKMPAKLAKVERNVNAFRRLVEAAVVESVGRIGVMEAALINSAARHETHAQLAIRWLRLGMDTLEPMERLAISKAIGAASSERDRCLKALGLGKRGLDTIDVAGFYQPPKVTELDTNPATSPDDTPLGTDMSRDAADDASDFEATG